MPDYGDKKKRNAPEDVEKKTRDEDSKLPVEEDAGIRSDNKSRGGKLSHNVSSVLKGSQFCSHASKPWLKRKHDVQHLPELTPGEGRGREATMSSPCGSGME